MKRSKLKTRQKQRENTNYWKCQEITVVVNDLLLVLLLDA